MMNQCSCKIILRKDLISKRTGCAPLALQATINRKRIVIAINQFVKPEDWNADKEMLNMKQKHLSDLNLLIMKAKSKAVEIFTEYRLLDVPLTASKFRELYLGENSRKDFIKFFEYELGLRLAGNQIENSTYKSHNNTLNKLKKFSKDKPILFSDINKKWLLGFDSWHLGYLKEKTKELGKPQINNSLNTRHIALKNIKTYLNIATKDEGIRLKNPFVDGMPVREVRGSREYLSPDELRTLIELYFSRSLGQIQKGVLARFLCSCFTSIRISDHMRLDLEYIEGEFLIFKPKKPSDCKKP